MLVPDRDVDQLRREVEVAVALVVPEVAALRPRDRHRADRVLHRPRVEDVAPRLVDDLLSGLRVGLDERHRPSLERLTGWRLSRPHSVRRSSVPLWKTG